ncbi:hypothetical protein SB861_02680 [Paraburkholderia sp. SIMBA_049]
MLELRTCTPMRASKSIGQSGIVGGTTPDLVTYAVQIWIGSF